jgi:hypothetical protein
MDKYESKESLRVLDEAAALQRRKSQDYQNPSSRIRQADHYPRGCSTIIDMVHQKITRIYSVMEAMETGKNANFESLEDSAIDAINYLSFFVSYARKKMDGQKKENDIFNRPLPQTMKTTGQE